MCGTRTNDLGRLYLLASVLVRRRYAQRLTLADISAALATSPRQVQRAYMQFGGCGFREDLLAVRLSTAAELLCECPQWSVAEVGRHVGYRDGGHFSRAFRRRYGVSPSGYRLRSRAGSPRRE